MKTKVEISDQVLNFVRSLAPEPRRSLRLALRGLEDERGDIKQLEGDLAGWCRLRVTSYRVIFRLLNSPLAVVRVPGKDGRMQNPVHPAYRSRKASCPSRMQMPTRPSVARDRRRVRAPGKDQL